MRTCCLCKHFANPQHVICDQAVIHLDHHIPCQVLLVLQSLHRLMGYLMVAHHIQRGRMNEWCIVQIYCCVPVSLCASYSMRHSKQMLLGLSDWLLCCTVLSHSTESLSHLAYQFGLTVTSEVYRIKFPLLPILQFDNVHQWHKKVPPPLIFCFLSNRKFFVLLIIDHAVVVNTVFLFTNQRTIFVKKSLQKCVHIIIWHHCHAGVAYTFSESMWWNRCQCCCHWVVTKVRIDKTATSDEFQSNLETATK